MRVQDQHGGDLSDALRGSLKEARKLLKQFPSISDPGADRILLFAAIAAIAALPSNNVSLIVRLRYGCERENYQVNYCQSQQVIEQEVLPKSTRASARTCC